jgi:hypothetical protein
MYHASVDRRGYLPRSLPLVGGYTPSPLSLSALRLSQVVVTPHVSLSALPTLARWPCLLAPSAPLWRPLWPAGGVWAGCWGRVAGGWERVAPCHNCQRVACVVLTRIGSRTGARDRDTSESWLPKRCPRSCPPRCQSPAASPPLPCCQSLPVPARSCQILPDPALLINARATSQRLPYPAPQILPHAKSRFVISPISPNDSRNRGNSQNICDIWPSDL